MGLLHLIKSRAVCARVGGAVQDLQRQESLKVSSFVCVTIYRIIPGLKHIRTQWLTDNVSVYYTLFLGWTIIAFLLQY